MLSLLYALALTPSSESPPPLRSDLPQISTTDYPPEALRNGWEGDVIADLTISIVGRVSACRIVQSSGYEVLDTATCRLFQDRARFRPARDGNGNEVEDTVRAPPVRWRLPR